MTDDDDKLGRVLDLVFAGEPSTTKPWTDFLRRAAARLGSEEAAAARLWADALAPDGKPEEPRPRGRPEVDDAAAIQRIVDAEARGVRRCIALGIEVRRLASEQGGRPDSIGRRLRIKLAQR